MLWRRRRDGIDAEVLKFFSKRGSRGEFEKFEKLICYLILLFIFLALQTLQG